MIIKGILKAVKGDETWQEEFDLTTPAFYRSYAALVLCIPLFVLIIMAVVKYNDNPGIVPFVEINIILAIMGLSFSVIAYVLTLMFNTQSIFRPWVIVRNWAFLGIITAIAIAFGLYLLGLLPFSIAYMIGLALYLGILALDISLAVHIAKFDWAGAVFSAILISMTSIMILYLGLLQALS
ncbi:MAG: hypothetical protein JKX72_09135 [Robiginitomaculum sp.]|nr:hypothetical protein [Robiginitomaculum sp.]